MEVLGDEDVVVEALVPIGLAVVILVVQTGELVAAVNVDDVIDDFQPESFEQPGSETSPLDLFPVAFQSFNDPDVTVPCADGCGVAVGEEIETSGADGFSTGRPIWSTSQVSSPEATVEVAVTVCG